MATAYVEMIEDDRGDLVDITYYCEWCRPLTVLPWPAFDWPDYDVHCCKCNTLVHKGAETDNEA
jgi:hypothetical protein